MWGAAPRRRFAVVALAASALLGSTAAGSTGRSVALPAQLWAVEASSPAAVGAASIGARTLGINAVLVARRDTPDRLRAAARAATRNRLRLLVPAMVATRAPRSVAAAPTACRTLRKTLASAPCVVVARTLADVPALTRMPGIDVVVVRLARPAQVESLVSVGGRARLLARLALPAGIHESTWRSAVATVRAARKLDLAVAAASPAALRRFGLVLSSRETLGTPPAPAPGTPAGLRVVESAAASITVAWTVPPGPTPSAYGLYLDGASAGSSLVDSATLTELRCATSYTIEVEARSAAGKASTRARVSASTAPCAGGGGTAGGGAGGDSKPPSKPANLSKTSATATSISLTWTASFDEVGVTGYLVYADGAGAGTAIGTVHTVSGLSCGRSYTLGVEARDAAGNVSPRATIAASTSACAAGGDTVAPSAPTGLTPTSTGTSSVSVLWGAATDNVGVAGYGLYRSGSSVTSTTGLTYTFSGLGCGTSYSLAVDAYDAAGNRSARATITASTAVCPAPPPAPNGSVPVYTKQSPPATPTVAELPKLSSVSKDGVTWTFSQAVPVGTFITGDYYVVGPATVIAISPAPANGRNGSVKNLPPVDDRTGFDSRTSANRYDASLAVGLPVSLQPGDSLVSSVSVDTIGSQQRILFAKATGSPVKSVSVLTSVSAPQPPDAFRPSYVGRGAPIFHSRNLRRELLPRLAPVSGTPTLAQYEGYFRRPWVDNLFFNFDTPIEYMPDYAREIARATGIAALLLTLDYTPEQKEPLLVYLTQYGIDLHGLVQAGHPGWPAHGGHGSGRKLPIVLAGVLLEQPALQAPPGRYGEDMQTMLGGGWTGATALYAGHYGSSGTGQYGPYEHLQPANWPGLLGEDYRRCCTSSAWIGTALAATLIPNVKTTWNHAPFFSYTDRWMTENDTQYLATIKTQTGTDYSAFPQRRAWDTFVTNMWNTYR